MPLPDGIIDFALNFPSSTLDAPVITKFSMKTYHQVHELYGAFEQTAVNQRYFLGDVFVGGLLAQAMLLSELFEEINAIEATYYAYGGFADENLALTISDLDAVKGADATLA